MNDFERLLFGEFCVRRMEMQHEALMDVMETARYLNIGRSKLYEMAKAKMLPHLHVGASLRFDRSVLDEWIRQEMRVPSASRRDED